MFPESHLAVAFWNFVRGRALDWRSTVYEGGCRLGSQKLDKLEASYFTARSRILRAQADDDPRDDAPSFEEADFMPWTYPTLQEALIAFLMELAITTKAPFPYRYEQWLRTVVLVIADVQRDPSWLRIVIHWPESDNKFGELEHDMIVSDDWSCLSPETFEFIIRAYGQPT